MKSWHALKRSWKSSRLRTMRLHLLRLRRSIWSMMSALCGDHHYFKRSRSRCRSRNKRGEREGGRGRFGQSDEVDAARDRATPASVRHDDDEEEECKGFRIDTLILLPPKSRYSMCVCVCH